MNQPTSRVDRAKMYSEYLRSEGYAPEIDKDGDVRFKKEGRTYYIMVSESDPEYFRMIYPSFWSIESDEEREKVERAALHATIDTKVAKVYPTKDDTTASIAFFCWPPDAFKAVFERSMGALQTAVDTFVQKMRE